jgi:hypothetical protein
MSDRYYPDRGPNPWDEGEDHPTRRLPSRGGGGGRPGGRSLIRRPQPDWDDGSAPGYGGPEQPRYPPPPYPQPPYPPDGYGLPAGPSQATGRSPARRPGSGWYGGNQGNQAGGRTQNRIRAPQGQPGRGMQPPDEYGATSPYDRQQSLYGRTSVPPRDDHAPTLARMQRPPSPYGPPDSTYSGPMPPRRRRWPWIALAVVVVLLLAGGALGAWAVSQIAAPGVAAGEFCDSLRQQSYDAAYGRLSTTMRARFSQAQFHSAAADLDAAEGKVLSCGSAANTSYSPGSSTATLGLTVTRAKQGNLTGTLRMKKEGGAWKVDGLDTSLLGVNLAAVQTVETYCAALQGQKYDAVYTLLDSKQQGAQKQDSFTGDAKLRDQIDGKVSACGLEKVATGNSDATASVTLTVTRAKLGRKSGALTLGSEASQWRISAIAAEILGSDLQPLAVGKQFCGLLSQAKYVDAYNSTSAGFKRATSKKSFLGLFDVQGVKWTCGSAKISTYKVSGGAASYEMTLTSKDQITGETANQNARMGLVLEGSTWKVQGLASV